MLVVDRTAGRIEHAHVRDLPLRLTDQDLVVLNNTRVIPARLAGIRTNTGGRWFGLFLSADEQGRWNVMSKTRGKLKPAESVTLEDRDGRASLRLTLLAKLQDGTWVAQPEDDGHPFELLKRVGRIPLPQYIRDGNMVDADVQGYQTTFATTDGAVAAPTAGLHFTETLLDQLREKTAGIEFVTLHVGIGTFRPITSATLREHQMHAEWGSLDETAAARVSAVRASGGRAIAVGTTTVRVLETASAQGRLEAWQGETRLFIRPPYEFHTVDGLLTNFHLPKSSLLVLVRTFGGDDLIRQAYEIAIEEGYRFYSYGDAMLIL